MPREGSAVDVTLTNQYHKFILVGGPGTGKSQFAASCPTPGYVFDCDNGIISYKKLDFTYSQFANTNLGFIDFQREFNAVEKEAREGKYQTVVLDSATTLSFMAMERALTIDPKRSAVQGPLWNVHYGMVKNLIESIFKRLTSLPCNVVVICHKEIVKNEEDGSVVGIQPLLTGKLSENIPMLFDEVYYTLTQSKGGKSEWWMQTVPRGLTSARSRISGRDHILPDLIPNDYNAIMAFIAKTQTS